MVKYQKHHIKPDTWLLLFSLLAGRSTVLLATFEEEGTVFIKVCINYLTAFPHRADTLVSPDQLNFKFFKRHFHFSGTYR